MTKHSEDPGSPLVKLAGSLGLLAIALFFTGWVYRWHYYTYFQVEPSSLDLSGESTSFAALSLLFGNPLAFVKFLFGLALGLVGIVLTFRALRFCQHRMGPRLGLLERRL